MGRDGEDMERERGRDGTVRTYVQVMEGVIYAMNREDETEEEAREEDPGSSG